MEPYVVAGDIYAEAPHVGRGGWTWYTGSAGWLYRAGTEWILGFRVRGATLAIDPCIPAKWPGYSIVFRYHSSVYKVRVENPKGVTHGVEVTEVDGHLKRLLERRSRFRWSPMALRMVRNPGLTRLVRIEWGIRDIFMSR